MAFFYAMPAQRYGWRGEYFSRLFSDYSASITGESHRCTVFSARYILANVIWDPSLHYGGAQHVGGPVSVCETVVSTAPYHAGGQRRCRCNVTYIMWNISPITCWLASRARRARASQMTMYRFSWRVSQSPRHRCVRLIMTSYSNYRNVTRKRTQHRIFICKFLGLKRNQTLTLGRLFQSCISNYSQQEKLEHLESIFVTFTKFLPWVNLWYFGARIRVAARAKCGRQTMRIHIYMYIYIYEVIAILAIPAIT